MSELKPWKTRLDVERLTIGKYKLGEGTIGKVYIGKMWLKGQKPKRVAVKVFELGAAEQFFGKPEIDEEVIRHYEEAISKLRAAKVPVLKTGFVKHKGQWVQVQELYGATQKGSKIIDSRLPDKTINPALISRETQGQLLDVIAGIINAGLSPHPDTIGMVQTSKGTRLIVHDLDFLAHTNFIKDSYAADVQESLNRRLERWVAVFEKAGVKRRTTLRELKKRITHPNGITALNHITPWWTRT